MSEEEPKKKIFFGEVGRKDSEQELDIRVLLEAAAKSGTWLIFAPDGRMWNKASTEDLACILHNELVAKLGDPALVTLLIATFAVQQIDHVKGIMDGVIAKAKGTKPE